MINLYSFTNNENDKPIKTGGVVEVIKKSEELSSNWVSKGLEPKPKKQQMVKKKKKIRSKSK